MDRRASVTLTDTNLILLDATLAGLSERDEEAALSSTTASSVPASPYLSSAVASSSRSSEACTPPDLELPKPALPSVSKHAVDLIRREVEALTRLANRIDAGTAATDGFNRAVEILAGMHPHAKLVVTGLGKSALIGRKAVATFCSLGLPAVFVDPIAALHGDIGVLSPHGIDVALMISYSGRTAELLRLLPSLQARCRGGLIALTGDASTSLSLAADCWLDGMITDGEADAEVPAPSSSALVALAQLDALALCSLRLRVGWEAPGTARAAVFAHHHEGGQLGIKLKDLIV